MTRKKVCYLLVCIIIFGLIFSYYNISSELPRNLSILKNSESVLKFKFPFSVYVRDKKLSESQVLKINGQKIDNNYSKFSTDNPLTLEAEKVGQVALDFRLFGVIPIRTLKINVIPEVEVYPGGHAIGVLMKSKGVMVVGNSFVEGKDGKKYYPAQQAGITVGDRIIEVNGQTINDKLELASNIQKLGLDGSKIKLKLIKRNGEIKEVIINPVRNNQGIYMIGLYVDDSVAGVGTLTFYRPDSGEFGALGHLITESHSQSKIEVREGQIVNANISGINSGQKGLPGEKLGTFFETRDVLGRIIKNNKFGIYGVLEKEVNFNPYFDQPIPVATISSVQRGPAKMYTVLSGGRIEEFDVNIERVYRQSMPDAKGLVVSIVDPELKQSTGGIVQGMSGSPIVQDNKLVGAVTHVFVNNPTRGYGVFAEWMLLQTDAYKKAG